MTNDNILTLITRMCQGLPCRIPAMTPPQWAILLNEVAYSRENIHGPMPR
jgi:hypothetical protein